MKITPRINTFKSRTLSSQTIRTPNKHGISRIFQSKEFKYHRQLANIPLSGSPENIRNFQETASPLQIKQILEIVNHLYPEGAYNVRGFSIDCTPQSNNTIKLNENHTLSDTRVRLMLHTGTEAKIADISYNGNITNVSKYLPKSDKKALATEPLNKNQKNTIAKLLDKTGLSPTALVFCPIKDEAVGVGFYKDDMTEYIEIGTISREGVFKIEDGTKLSYWTILDSNFDPNSYAIPSLITMYSKGKTTIKSNNIELPILESINSIVAHDFESTKKSKDRNSYLTNLLEKDIARYSETQKQTISPSHRIADQLRKEYPDFTLTDKQLQAIQKLESIGLDMNNIRIKPNPAFEKELYVTYNGTVRSDTLGSINTKGKLELGAYLSYTKAAEHLDPSEYDLDTCLKNYIQKEYKIKGKEVEYKVMVALISKIFKYRLNQITSEPNTFLQPIKNNFPTTLDSPPTDNQIQKDISNPPKNNPTTSPNPTQMQQWQKGFVASRRIADQLRKEYPNFTLTDKQLQAIKQLGSIGIDLDKLVFEPASRIFRENLIIKIKHWHTPLYTMSIRSNGTMDFFPQFQETSADQLNLVEYSKRNINEYIQGCVTDSYSRDPYHLTETQYYALTRRFIQSKLKALQEQLKTQLESENHKKGFVASQKIEDQLSKDFPNFKLTNKQKEAIKQLESIGLDMSNIQGQPDSPLKEQLVIIATKVFLGAITTEGELKLWGYFAHSKNAEHLDPSKYNLNQCLINYASQNYTIDGRRVEQEVMAPLIGEILKYKLNFQQEQQDLQIHLAELSQMQQWQERMPKPLTEELLNKKTIPDLGALLSAFEQVKQKVNEYDSKSASTEFQVELTEFINQLTKEEQKVSKLIEAKNVQVEIDAYVKTYTDKLQALNLEKLNQGAQKFNTLLKSATINNDPHLANVIKGYINKLIKQAISKDNEQSQSLIDKVIQDINDTDNNIELRTETQLNAIKTKLKSAQKLIKLSSITEGSTKLKLQKAKEIVQEQLDFINKCITNEKEFQEQQAIVQQFNDQYETIKQAIKQNSDTKPTDGQKTQLKTLLSEINQQLKNIPNTAIQSQLGKLKKLITQAIHGIFDLSPNSKDVKKVDIDVEALFPLNDLPDTESTEDTSLKDTKIIRPPKKEGWFAKLKGLFFTGD